MTTALPPVLSGGWMKQAVTGPQQVNPCNGPAGGQHSEDFISPCWGPGWTLPACPESAALFLQHSHHMDQYWAHGSTPDHMGQHWPHGSTPHPMDQHWSHGPTPHPMDQHWSHGSTPHPMDQHWSHGSTPHSTDQHWPHGSTPHPATWINIDHMGQHPIPWINTDHMGQHPIPWINTDHMGQHPTAWINTDHMGQHPTPPHGSTLTTWVNTPTTWINHMGQHPHHMGQHWLHGSTLTTWVNTPTTWANTPNTCQYPSHMGQKKPSRRSTPSHGSTSPPHEMNTIHMGQHPHHWGHPLSHGSTPPPLGPTLPHGSTPLPLGPTLPHGSTPPPLGPILTWVNTPTSGANPYHLRQHHHHWGHPLPHGSLPHSCRSTTPPHRSASHQMGQHPHVSIPPHMGKKNLLPPPPMGRHPHHMGQHPHHMGQCPHHMGQHPYHTGQHSHHMGQLWLITHDWPRQRKTHSYLLSSSARRTRRPVKYLLSWDLSSAMSSSTSLTIRSSRRAETHPQPVSPNSTLTVSTGLLAHTLHWRSFCLMLRQHPSLNA